MQLTTFGYTWLTLIFLAFISKKEKKLTMLLLISMILQSNSVLIINNELSIGPSIITASIFLLKHFSALLKYKRNTIGAEKRNFLWFIGLLMIMLFTSIQNKIIDYYVLLNIIMILVYYLVFMIISVKNVGFNSEKEVLKFLSILSLFIVFIGIWQLLIEYSILSNRVILEKFIYSDTFGSVAFNTKIIKRFYSTFMEPSYTSAYLLAIISYFTLSEKSTLKNNIITMILIISLILTKSTTGFAAFILIIFYWIFINKKLSILKKTIIVYLFLFMILVIFIFDPNLFINILFKKNLTASYQTRNNWNIWAIDAFRSHPLFGVGFKQQRASSLILTLLAEVGLLGLSIYLFWLMNLYFIGKQKKIIASFSMILSVFFNQLIASPDITLSVFWLSLFIFGLNVYFNKEALNEDKFISLIQIDDINV